MTADASASTAAQLGEPGEAEHHLAVQRHAAADQPGVPALRNHGPAGFGAQRQHGRHLGRIPWSDDGQRPALESPGPVHGEPGRGVALEHMPLADDGG